MSDYGAKIKVTKKSGDFGQSDKKRLIGLSQELKGKKWFSDVLGDDFLFRAIESGDNSMSLLLAEYWYGEGDNQENFEWTKNYDLGESQKVADALISALDEEFLVEVKFENW